MNRPTTAREALVAEAIGDVARLLDRVESLVPLLDRTRLALAEANATLVEQVDALEGRMATITQTAKVKTVEHLARHADAVAMRSTEQQTRAMTEAARAIFGAEVEPALQRLARSLQHLAERVDRPWERWLVHAATVTTSCAVTWAAALYVLLR